MHAIPKKEKDCISFNLDIGWYLKIINSKWYKKGRHTKVIKKVYLGSVYCASSSCQMKGVDFRPNTTENAIDNQKCIICGSNMKRKLCNVKVNFKFGDAKFIMDHRGERTHGACPPIDLTEHEKKVPKKKYNRMWDVQ